MGTCSIWLWIVEGRPHATNTQSIIYLDMFYQLLTNCIILKIKSDSFLHVSRLTMQRKRKVNALETTLCFFAVFRKELWTHQTFCQMDRAVITGYLHLITEHYTI